MENLSEDLNRLAFIIRARESHLSLETEITTWKNKFFEDVLLGLSLCGTHDFQPDPIFHESVDRLASERIIAVIGDESCAFKLRPYTERDRRYDVDFERLVQNRRNL